MALHFRHTVLGGTFDHFHRGHRHFIDSACKQSSQITIGITVQPFNLKSFPLSLESYSDRHQTLQSHLRQKNYPAVNLIPLYDVYGTTLTDKSIDAVFVTQETLPGANMINLKRISLALHPLSVNIVPHVLGNDKKIINSTRIREGLINREGFSYLSMLENNNLTLPDSLRSKLHKPLGEIVSSLTALSAHIPPNSLVITVGDVVSQTLYNSPFHPHLSIIDGKSNRTPLPPTNPLPADLTLDNPPGTINPSFARLFLSALKSSSPQQVFISGEEDLLALPSILLAPLDSFVLYGQPGKGIVVVKITEQTKKSSLRLLSRFHR